MKTKTVSASVLVGSIFGFIGVLFSVIGSVFMINIEKLRANATGNGDIIILPLIFMGIGFGFVLIAAFLLTMFFLKERRIKRMVAEGHYIYATVSDIITNFNITINGRHPFFLECRYQDPYTSEIHIFRSKNIYYRPVELLDTEIRVWVDRNNYSVYLVDIDGIMQNVRYH